MHQLSDAPNADPRKLLEERITLIEQFIMDGRTATRAWGEFFVLWGAGISIALVWTQITNGWLPWPVMILVCAVLQIILWQRRKRQHHALANMQRVLQILWLTTAISLTVGGVLCGTSARVGTRGLQESAFLLMATANGVSGFLLRWPLQIAIALLWWFSAAAVLFVPDPYDFWLYLSALVIGEFGFGLYLMIDERLQRNQ